MKRFLIWSLMLSIIAVCQAQLDMLKVKITNSFGNEEVKTKIEQNAGYLLASFNRSVMDGKSPKFDKTRFVAGADRDVSMMLKSSPIACPVSVVEEQCLSLPGGGYQIRNIPVTLLDAPEATQAQELVINFNREGLIDNVLMAMDQQRYADLLGAHITLDDFARRQVIVDFVENFRTAYNRKDISYLTTVFSDDAIIITGKVLKPRRSGGDVKMLSPERIEYTSQTKEQYLTGLKRTFKVNKYIDVGFEDIEVMRHPVRKNIYGVTLKQDWKSSRYNDTGFVFLMIDFTDELQPVIQVRTWQPEKFQGRPLNRDEIFSLDNFSI